MVRASGVCAAVLAAALLAAWPAQAAGPLTWGSPVPVDAANKTYAIACPTTSFCVTGGESDHIAVTTDPVHGPWSVSQITVSGPASPNNAISEIACVGANDCIAVDHNGHVMTTQNAGGGGGAWSATQYGGIAGAANFTGLSCPSASLCVAVDNRGGLVVSTSPLNSAAWTWKATPRTWSNVSCAPAFCVATSGADVYYTSQPTSDPAGWSTSTVDPVGKSLGPVACTAAPLCVAGDQTLPVDGANVFTTTTPDGGASAWTPAPFPEVTNMTCATTPSLLCTASHFAGGYVEASTNPAGGLSTWTAVDNVGGGGVNVRDVSCPTSLLCVAALNNGSAVPGVGVGLPGGGGGGGGGPAGPPVTPPGPLFGTVFSGVVIQGSPGRTYTVGPTGFALYLQVSAASVATVSGTTADGAQGTAKTVAAKRYAIAPVTVKLAANVRTKLQLKLTKRARALLAKTRRLKVRLTIDARRADGARKTTTQLVTLVKRR